MVHDNSSPSTSEAFKSGATHEMGTPFSVILTEMASFPLKTGESFKGST